MVWCNRSRKPRVEIDDFLQFVIHQSISLAVVGCQSLVVANIRLERYHRGDYIFWVHLR